MPRLIIFDDRDHPGCGSDVADLSPMTDLRASFEVRTGMLTTQDRLLRQWPRGPAALWVPEALRAVVAERSAAPVNALPDEDRFLCVNGRWAFPASTFELAPGQALIERQTQHVIAAHLLRADARAFFEARALPEVVERIEYDGQLLVRRPWEVLAALPRVLVTDLLATEFPTATALPDGVTVIGDEPVMVHPSARLYPQVVLDAESGPIVIDERAIVRPGATIIGPCYVGVGSSVLDRALIKANTAIGPVCKVSGEVGATIFQGYSNKAHDGHLGDSWIGEWVNIGAGTTNSNLLNTYGPVKMRQRSDGPIHATGMMYLGAIVGDHVKFAIGTRLMTGSVIGAGSMIALSTPPPTTLDAFTWITDAGSKRYSIDPFLKAARRVMERRDVTLSPAIEAALRALFDETGRG